jgi:glycosyltransferase involved in cell wall biosynthesis
MLLFTVLSAHRGFCSTSYFTDLLKKIPFTKNKIIHLPVGPTIEIPKELKTGHVNKILKLVIFGGYHPSKRYDIIFDTLERLFNEKYKFELTIIGTTIEKLTNDIELPKNFSQWAKAIGKQDDNNVVSIFEESDFLISYFSDGMSTRRSSAISALALGLPIISTKTKRTDNILLSNSDLILFDIDNFETSLYTFIKSSPKAPLQSSLYENHLNWTQIVRKFTHNLLV